MSALVSRWPDDNRRQVLENATLQAVLREACEQLVHALLADGAWGDSGEDVEVEVGDRHWEGGCCPLLTPNAKR